MKIEQEKDVFDLALAKWGKITQINKLGEECAELDKLTHKYLGYISLGQEVPESLYLEMCEEIADVLNMIEQFKRIHPDLANEIKTQQKLKLARVMGWIKE